MSPFICADCQIPLAQFETAEADAYATTLPEAVDLARKVEKAARIKGPRLIHALAPCPPGWDYDPQETVEIGRLAVKCGIWPLREYENGRIVHTRVPHPRVPVEEYLRRQGRFRHLFEPQRDEQALAAIQAGVDAYWSSAG